MDVLSFTSQIKGKYRCPICSLLLVKDEVHWHCPAEKGEAPNYHKFSFSEPGSFCLIDLHMGIYRNNKFYEATLHFEDRYAFLNIFSNEFRTERLFSKTFNNDFDFSDICSFEALFNLMDTYLLFS